ncbi:hypothetical protein F4821DRAFT_224856 [Hypoxylon rubiginosum]|uniref:Uncharacterized protein n=1 Tax=Hypoxylon rubiginosum TaxID=110542 RepID=A0ACC0DHM4_9PEZI|nr:hypothetical protein F4821DRAFT_224856 [Hypoxylon rubiginosum]
MSYSSMSLLSHLVHERYRQSRMSPLGKSFPPSHTCCWGPQLPIPLRPPHDGYRERRDTRRTPSPSSRTPLLIPTISGVHLQRPDDRLCRYCYPPVSDPQYFLFFFFFLFFIVATAPIVAPLPAPHDRYITYTYYLPIYRPGEIRGDPGGGGGTTYLSIGRPQGRKELQARERALHARRISQHQREKKTPML